MINHIQTPVVSALIKKPIVKSRFLICGQAPVGYQAKLIRIWGCANADRIRANPYRLRINANCECIRRQVGQLDSTQQSAEWPGAT